MLEEILDALIGSEPFERLLASRERPLVARAPAGADFVLAATARALESPILAVASGPQDAEQLTRGVGGWLGQERVALLPAWESLPYEGISPAPEVAAAPQPSGFLAAPRESWFGRRTGRRRIPASAPAG